MAPINFDSIILGFMRYFTRFRLCDRNKKETLNDYGRGGNNEYIDAGLGVFGPPSPEPISGAAELGPRQRFQS